MASILHGDILTSHYLPMFLLQHFVWWPIERYLDRPSNMKYWHLPTLGQHLKKIEVFSKSLWTLFKFFLSTHLCYIKKIYIVGKILFSRIFEMKKMNRKKNEEFSARPKISNWYFLEYMNFADSKSKATIVCLVWPVCPELDYIWQTASTCFCLKFYL